MNLENLTEPHNLSVSSRILLITERTEKRMTTESRLQDETFGAVTMQILTEVDLTEYVNNLEKAYIEERSKSEMLQLEVKNLYTTIKKISEHTMQQIIPEVTKLERKFAESEALKTMKETW